MEKRSVRTFDQYITLRYFKIYYLRLCSQPFVDTAQSLICLSYFCSMFGYFMLAIGMIKSYGILYEELLDYFDSSAGSTAFIASTANFIQHGGGIYNIFL